MGLLFGSAWAHTYLKSEQVAPEIYKWGFWDRTRPLLEFCLMSYPNEKI